MRKGTRGRPKTNRPLENVVSFRASDDELIYIDALSKALGVERAEAIRKVLKIAFQIDPMELKKALKKSVYKKFKWT